jgi:hypothetical protein
MRGKGLRIRPIRSCYELPGGDLHKPSNEGVIPGYDGATTPRSFCHPLKVGSIHSCNNTSLLLDRGVGKSTSINRNAP